MWKVKYPRGVAKTFNTLLEMLAPVEVRMKYCLEYLSILY